jgi:hypothetical protein
MYWPLATRMHELVANNQNAFIHGQAFMATSRMCSASQSFNAKKRFLKLLVKLDILKP